MYILLYFLLVLFITLKRRVGILQTFIIPMIINAAVTSRNQVGFVWS